MEGSLRPTSNASPRASPRRGASSRGRRRTAKSNSQRLVFSAALWTAIFVVVGGVTGISYGLVTSQQHEKHGDSGGGASNTPVASSNLPTASPYPTLTASPTNTVTASVSPAPPSVTPTVSPPPTCADTEFKFWNGLTHDAAWMDPLDVNRNVSFVTSGNVNTAGRSVNVHVDWADHYANQLFGNPAFLQLYDDRIREWNPNASMYSGSIDECGWPDDPKGPGLSRKPDCFYEDFSGGWVSDRLRVSLAKSCCTKDPIQFKSPGNYTYYPSQFAPEYSVNINPDVDDVEYPPGHTTRKNVLRLTAINKDNNDPASCGTCVKGQPCPSCHKEVLSAGLVETAELFASARYDIIAKVPYRPGLVFAMWTFHYEEHIPWRSCDQYGNYKSSYRGENPAFPPHTTWANCCGEGCCALPRDRPASCPPVGSPECYCCTNFLASGPIPGSTLCDKSWNDAQKNCTKKHSFPDPQFTDNATVNSWKVMVNHEIDIEIPANCMGTSVCSESATNQTFEWREKHHPGCIGRTNTVNLNNYIFTTPGGTGPAYSNMCVKATYNDTGEPFEFLGDDKYHKYTIDWHTGGQRCMNKSGTLVQEPGRVDFYIDDVYIGTNNVFAPSRASRLVLGIWSPTSHYNWNNWPDNWGGGTPGDGLWYTADAYISEVRIQPHNEPNDIVYPGSYDLPDKCKHPFYLSHGVCHRHWEATPTRAPLDDNPGPGVLANGQCKSPTAK